MGGCGKYLSLGQKLPFWDNSCRFRDINCRLEDKLQFRDKFLSGPFSAIVHCLDKIAVLGRKLPFSRHKLPF